MPYRFGAFLLCAYSFKIHTTPHIPRTRPRIGDIAFTICARTDREQRSTAFLLFFFPEPIHCSGWGWVGASEQPYIHIVSYLVFSYRYDSLRLYICNWANKYAAASVPYVLQTAWLSHSLLTVPLMTIIGIVELIKYYVNLFKIAVNLAVDTFLCFDAKS